tara:strand:+ start:97 stop:678 length:582 start_codon:yes stop_codon:yes gene_type:complete
MSLSHLSHPIPGQSLTSEPGNAAWEKPSKFSDPMDVLEMYMEKLGNEEVVDDVMDMLDIGIPINTVAGSMLGMGVMEGLHTVDVKLLLRPLVAAHIKSLADVVGVDYKMTMADYDDKDAKAAQKRKAKLAAKLAIQTGAVVPAKADEGEEIMMETQQQLEQPQEEAEAPEVQEVPEVQQEQPAEASVGLMAKG